MSDTLNAGFPLSPQQKQLWGLAADGSVLNAAISVVIEGTLDRERLKSALLAVIARHEILRTTFDRQPGMKSAIQVVRETLSPLWEESDFCSFDPEQQKNRLQETFDAQMQTSFDLAQGPVVRANLVALTDQKHVLIVALPSLCADGATLNSLAIEIARAYESASLNGEIFQYADYAAFANESVQEEAEQDARSAKQFWKDLLSEASPSLQLPFQRNTASDGNFQPQTILVDLPGDVASISSPAEFFFACWHILLWRLSGQNRIVLSRISDGRNHDELKEAMGAFARPLPIVYELDGSTSFSGVMQNIRDLWSKACERQDYFAGDVPSFDKAPAFVAVELPAPIAGKSAAFSISRSEARSLFSPIQLRAVIKPGSVALEIVFDPRYFSRYAAERIAKQFAVLATSATQNSSLPIAQLPIMSEAERRQVVVEFNNTAAAYPQDKSLHELFEATVARVPDQPALRFGETVFSYSQLNSRANQLAHLLRRKGVKPGVAVPLCLDRSAEMIIALLGILKAGGAYVPLVPDNPRSRLAQQVSDSNSPVLISEQKFLTNLPDFGGEIISLDRDEGFLHKESTDNPNRLNSPADTAYVIYTSGSTGVPKGVEVSHANLVNYSWFITRKLNATAEPLNFATVSTLAADLGNTAIFPALISGGCLHVVGYDTAMATDRFAEYVRRHPIDVLKITPSHLSSLLTAPGGERVLPRKYLVLGGEAASWDLVSRIQQVGACKVINHYGPTEATVGCCTFSVSDNDVSSWTPTTVPIGKPIANAQAYILDQRLQPVPVGVPGELCIGGAGIAKGYLHQPQQTAERFETDSFSNQAGARLYRTGDLARFLPDGNIEFLGRIDQQVKIRGFRVEPAEIESVLKKNPFVQQAVVLARSNADGDKRLIAYVVPNRKSAQLASDLRSHLQQYLPDYMVPSAVVPLDALPLTRNGKIDTAALPSPEEIAVEHAIVAPRNPVEQGLADIWRQVLRIERVGVEDNFFDLGGHSLLATQVISRIRSTFHVQLPLRSLFDAPTVAGLAEQIAALPQGSEDDEVARLLQELEGMSDEEAERLLGQEMGNAAEGSGND